MKKLTLYKFKSTPILLEHQLEELKEIKDNKELLELKLLHNHQYYVYLYYEKLSMITSNYGFELTLNFSSVKSDDMILKGIAYTFNNNIIFNNISTAKYEDVCDINIFYDSLLHIPQPFLFLPTCTLFDVQNIMKNILYTNKIIKFRIYNKIIYLLDPIGLRNLDLHFFIKDHLKRDDINSLYFGFIFEERKI